MPRFVIVPILALLLSACDPVATAKSDVLGDCPVPTGGPTMHDRESITADTTWSAADGPHVIEGYVYVEEGATLTIEPCAEVRLNPDAILDVRGGRLVAEGDAEAPILLTRNGSAPWGYVEVMWPGTASFASVVMEGGGGDYANAGYATLMARGPYEAHATEVIEVHDLRIEDSYGPGVWMFEDGTFVDGSTSLVVTGSGEGDGSDPTFAYPVVTGVSALTNLPDGDYTGNVRDAILVVANDSGGGYMGFLDDTTVHDRGVPYDVGVYGAGDGRLRPGSPAEAVPVTLTVEAGVTMRFLPEGAIVLQQDVEGNIGVLRALGTAQSPVTFTSQADDPAAGDWVGIVYASAVHPGNLIQNTVIAYAGADSSSGGYTCPSDAGNDAAVIFHEAIPSEVFITDSTIRASAGHAFLRGWTGAPLDFASANTLEDIAGCDQTGTFDTDGSCLEGCE